MLFSVCFYAHCFVLLVTLPYQTFHPLISGYAHILLCIHLSHEYLYLLKTGYMYWLLYAPLPGRASFYGRAYFPPCQVQERFHPVER